VTVEVVGREAVTLSRLGSRTDELAGLLTRRLREARGRTAAFLGSLLPGLDPMALREAAGLLRDGVAVPVDTLDGIHPDLASTPLEVAALPARRDAVAELGRRASLAIGFKQIASVRTEAVGVTPWQDHAATPHIGGHGSPGGSFGTGMMGLMAAGVMSGGPPMGPGGSGGPGGMFGYGDGYGRYGDYWAFQALGAGMNSGQSRSMTPRPDVTRGRLIPAGEDLPALVASGDDPTVLAFVLGGAGDRVVYEVLNRPEPMTYVYQAAGPDPLATINRALDDAGFQPAAVHAGGLAGALAGRAAHDAQWPARIAELLP
jgi:hypothetical protein